MATGGRANGRNARVTFGSRLAATFVVVPSRPVLLMQQAMFGRLVVVDGDEARHGEAGIATRKLGK